MLLDTLYLIHYTQAWISRPTERFGGESNGGMPESPRNTSLTLTERHSHTTEVDLGIRNEQYHVTPDPRRNAIQPALPALEIAIVPIACTVETTRPSKIQRYDRNVVMYVIRGN